MINVPGSEEFDVKQYEVEKINESEIVDTNGAGDSFVGGFFSQLSLGRNMGNCIKAGIYLSRECVKRSGCTFPENFEYAGDEEWIYIFH